MKIVTILFLLSLYLLAGNITNKTWVPIVMDDVTIVVPANIKPTHLLKNDTIKYYKTWKNKYLLEVDSTMSRIVDKESRTVSEGQGYGMLIEALLPHGVESDDEQIFNALWKFSRSRPSSICSNLMNWKYDPQNIKDDDSAFDGDADIAYALIKAAEKWGSGGVVNYKNEALKVLNDIWNCTIGLDSKLPLLGDWVEQDGTKYNQYTARTSDFMLGHFRKFAQFTGDDKWLEVVTATQNALKEVQNETTGLVPDFIKKDSHGHYVAVENGFLEENDGDYSYNACRVPWRLGVDVMQSHDNVTRNILSKMTHWMKSTSHAIPENIKAGYTLDGNVIGDYDTNAFIAPFGVAATALGDGSYAKKIRQYMIRDTEGYYEDTIALLSLMAMDGVF